MNLIRSLRFLQEKFLADKGSASLEFSALAIPLFIPIFIFLNQFSSASANEEMARSLAREAVRIFVLSSNESDANSASQQIVRVGASYMGFSEKQVRNISLVISCSENPCLTPNARVTATVSIPSSDSSRITRASSQEYVSPWQ